MTRERRLNPTDLILAVLLVGLSMFVFRSVLDAAFINYDDPGYVTANLDTQQGNVGWAFKTFYLSNWHPLTWLSHMLDCALFGIEPTGHHLTSLLLHSANGVLLFYLLHGLTGSRWRSVLVAALFLCHPLHVESVAWVSERKDVLSTCFGLVALLFYSRYGRQGNRIHLGVAWIFFALSLMAKPMLVTMPFLLLLLDVWPLKRLPAQPGQWGRVLLEKVPFFALSIASSAVTLAAQKAEVATVDALPFLTRIGNAAVSYLLYLSKTIWPAKLAAFYPYTQHPLWLIMVSVLVLLGISFLVLRTRKSQPALALGWLWYLGTLIPVIGLVQVGHQSMADRYTYVPLIGIFIMGAWSIPARWLQADRSRAITTTIVAALVLVCAWRADYQARLWRNSETLFGHALKITAKNYVAHNNYGIALSERGEFTTAISNFRRSVEIYPGNASAHYNLGGALYQTGQIEEAKTAFREALKYEPNHLSSRNWLGLLLAGQKQYSEAEREFKMILEQEPQNLDALGHLAFVRERQGDFKQAVALYEQALKIAPHHAELHYRYGNALMNLSQNARATEHFRNAINLNPQLLPAWLKLSSLAETNGNIAEAKRCLNEILRLQPDHAEARSRLNRLGGN